MQSPRDDSAANDDLTLGDIEEQEAWEEHTRERIETMADERSAAQACKRTKGTGSR